jgi:hypothetical protein
MHASVEARPVGPFGVENTGHADVEIQQDPAAAWDRVRRSRRALRVSAVVWLGVAILGQLLFAGYVLGFYGRALALGQPERWAQVLPHGLVAGQPFLNVVLGLHLLFAFAVFVGGALQLLPVLRRRWPGLHRWNGRLYLLGVSLLSIGGLIMVWTRGTVGDLSQHLAISLNALLILAFAATAWRHARARRFDLHRRWALRLFLVVSGVWFFRIGLMLWVVINRGPVGFDPASFTGPFLSFLAFAQYLLPLAMAELYFRAEARVSAKPHWVMAATLCGCTVLTAAGTAAAAGLMWLPRL